MQHLCSNQEEMLHEKRGATQSLAHHEKEESITVENEKKIIIK